MAYSWPCFKEFFSQKISKDIKFKKRNLFFNNKNQILLEINNDSLYRKNTKIIDIDKFIIKSAHGLQFVEKVVQENLLY